MESRRVQTYQWLPGIVLIAAAFGAAVGTTGPLPLAVLGVGVVGVGLLAFPLQSAVVLLALTPFYDTIVVKLGPADIRMLEVAWAIVAVSMAVRALAKRPVKTADVPAWVVGLVGAIVLWNLASLQYSVLPERSAVEVAQTIYLGLVLVLAAAVVGGLSVKERIAAMRGAAWSFLLAFGISVMWRFLFGATVPKLIFDQSGLYAAQGTIKTQAAGLGGVVLERFNLLTIGNVESASVFLVVIVIGLAVLLEKRWRDHRALALACVIFATAGLLLTYSRAGWVAAFVVIWLMGARLGPKQMTITTAVMIGIATVAMFHPVIGARIVEIFDVRESSFAIHLRLWLTALYMVSVQPLFGWGPGVFKHVSPELRIAEDIWPWAAHEDAHNFVLQSASELGYIGAALIVVLVASLLLVSWLGSRRSKSMVAFSLFAAALGVILMALTQNGFRTEITWVMLGLALVPWIDTRVTDTAKETAA